MAGHVNARPHRSRSRAIAAAAGAVVLSLGALTGAIARSGPAEAAPGQAGPSWPTLAELELQPPTAAQQDGSIIRYQVEGSVRSVETVEVSRDEVVIDLASDILFATDEADLPTEAGGRIAELLADVPQGATLAVHGHTDSRASEEYNLDLSRRRAEAVAAAVAAARPDLTLDVQGFGESQLKVPEEGDDIAVDRAANRRVELRYRT